MKAEERVSKTKYWEAYYAMREASFKRFNEGKNKNFNYDTELLTMRILAEMKKDTNYSDINSELELVKISIIDEMMLHRSTLHAITDIFRFLDYEMQHIDDIEFDKKTAFLLKKRQRLQVLKNSLTVHEEHTELVFFKLVHLLAQSQLDRTIAAVAYHSEYETNKLLNEMMLKIVTTKTIGQHVQS